MQHVERSIIRLFSPVFSLLALTFLHSDNIISVYEGVSAPILDFQIIHSSTQTAGGSDGIACFFSLRSSKVIPIIRSKP